MFNNYTWSLYLKSNKDTIKLFRDTISKEKISKKYLDKIIQLHQIYNPDSSITEGIKKDLIDVIEEFNQGYFIINDNSIKELTIDSILDKLIQDIKKYQETDKDTMLNFISYITYYTTFLFFMFPDLFIPYYFQYNFNFLKLITKELNIELPEIPLRNDYIGRIKYYGTICKVLREFQFENELSTEELCALIYEFAPNYLGGYSCYIVEDYGSPEGAYFIGASLKDNYFLKNKNALKNKDTITLWQANPETKVGDAIVMYLTSPDSSIDYIWRSVSKGFNDPFFFYYRCTYISNPTKVHKIRLKKLKSNRRLKKMSIVRKNMQGINGTEIYPSDYNYLLDLMKSNLERIDFGILKGKTEYKDEHDFEFNYLNFLVEKLGYKREEFVNQLNIIVGNSGSNFKLIPDIVLLPILESNVFSAFTVIEAKVKIQNNKELVEAKNQVKSYARQLLCKFAVVASPEKIWIMCSDDDFKKVIFEVYTEELENPDVFRKLKLLIGKPEKDI